MDEIDRAAEAEEWYRSQALDNRDIAASVLPFTGQCHNCEAVIDIGSFCDSDCRDDYEKRVSRHRYEKRAKGKIK